MVTAANREVTEEIEAHLPLTPLSFHILLALADGERHGYGILKEIERRTSGRMKTASGALYLAAVRLEDSGLIEVSDRRPASGADDQRRKYYRLTVLGRGVAAAEAARLSDLLGVAFDTGLVKGSRPEVEPAPAPASPDPS
jgi:DNA-binding PadR family transcriptional regulator